MPPAPRGRGSAAPGVARSAPAPGPIATHYRDAAAKILAAARDDRGAYRKLAYLTDHIGHRISGSEALDQAIAWAQKAMTEDGHENVRAEKVMVPHWVRGEESAEIVAPIKRPLVVLGLGMTPGTPKGGVTAPLVVVRDFDELDALGDRVRGKMVLFDHAMPPFSATEGSHYGDTVRFRGEGRCAPPPRRGRDPRQIGDGAQPAHTPHRHDDGQGRHPDRAVGGGHRRGFRAPGPSRQGG